MTSNVENSAAEICTPSGTGGARVWQRRPTAIWTALVLLGIAILVLPAPWRMPASNDEMLHLKSWRNRYGTDDVFPIGRHKIAKAKHIPAPVRNLALAIYDSGPIGQRLFIVMQDCHPSLWPITAEIMASVTDSSLVAIRLLSTLCFVLTLYLLYCIGCHLHGWSEGLLLASLWSISYLALEYAGTARMYASAMAALALFLYYYLKIDVKDDRQFRNLALLAILPISLEWFTWPAVYMLLALAVLQRVRGVRGWRQGLARHKSLIPFFLVCGIFFCYYYVLRNFHPSASPEYSAGRGVHPAYEHLMEFLAQIGPFSFLCSLTDGLSYIAAANVAFFTLGAILFLRDTRTPLAFRATVVLLAIAAFVLPTQIRMLPRHYMLATFVPFVFFTLAVVTHLPKNSQGLIGLILLVPAIGILYSQDRFFGKDNVAYDHPRIAQTVASSLQGGEKWIAFPYQRAMSIYRYAELPEPVLATSQSEFEQVLANIPPGESRIVLTGKHSITALSAKYRKWFTRDHLIAEFPTGDVVYRITATE